MPLFDTLVDHELLLIHFTTDRIPATAGGVARTKELLAITAGLNHLLQLHLSGQVITECLGVVTTLQNRTALKRQLSKHGASLIQSSFRSLSAI